MKKTKINNFLINDFPDELHPFIKNASIYDSSSSPMAKVYFIDKDQGYFLKRAAKQSLGHEAMMTQYFHQHGLAAPILSYTSDDQFDWMLTQQIPGDDLTTQKYLDNPEKLAESMGQVLAELHARDFQDCPIKNYSEIYFKRAESNYQAGHFNEGSRFASANQAWEFINNKQHTLQSDTLIHGDFCLPNIIFNDWNFSGYLDLDGAGVGDRHIDLYWGLWSLAYNLQTDAYGESFLAAYGKENVDEEKLILIEAVECFG